jgi:putative endonuclease
VPFVYVVRCADGTLYTGWTTDLARRVSQHNAGRGARYTRIHGPVVLVYREEVPDRSAAMRRERTIKKLDRMRKISLIEQGYDPDLESYHGSNERPEVSD